MFRSPEDRDRSRVPRAVWWKMTSWIRLCVRAFAIFFAWICSFIVPLPAVLDNIYFFIALNAVFGWLMFMSIRTYNSETTSKKT